MSLPTIILVRHGQTLWNAEGRYQGQLNSNLTELGQKQARENALKVSRAIRLDEPFSFYSSPLGRAKETALIICDELNLDRGNIIFDNRVQEVSYGIFEGKTKEFCKKNYSKEFKAREDNKWSHMLAGGESYEMVTKRLYSWLEDIKDSDIVVLVAHAMVSRALRGIYCNYPIEKMLKLEHKNDTVIKLENNQESIVE